MKLDPSKLKPGWRVRISIEGTVVPRDDVPGGVVIQTDSGAQYCYLDTGWDLEWIPQDETGT